MHPNWACTKTRNTHTAIFKRGNEESGIHRTRESGNQEIGEPRNRGIWGARNQGTAEPENQGILIIEHLFTFDAFSPISRGIGESESQEIEESGYGYL